MDWIAGIIQLLSCSFTAWILFVLHNRLTTSLKGIRYFALAFLAWAAAGGYIVTLSENPAEHSFTAIAILTLCSMVNNYYFILGAQAINDGEVTSRLVVRWFHTLIPNRTLLLSVFVALYGLCLLLVYRHDSKGYLLEMILSTAVVVVVTVVLCYTMRARKLGTLWALTLLAGGILIYSQWKFYAHAQNIEHHDTWLLASLFSKTSWSGVVIVVAVTWLVKENAFLLPQDLGLEMTVRKDKSKNLTLALLLKAYPRLNQDWQLIPVPLRKKKTFRVLLRLCLYKKYGINDGYLPVQQGTDLDNYNSVPRDLMEMLNLGLAKGEMLEIEDFFEIRNRFGVKLRVPPEFITLERSSFRSLPRRHARYLLHVFTDIENLLKRS